jgi:hypothetical protein
MTSVRCLQASRWPGAWPGRAFGVVANVEPLVSSEDGGAFARHRRMAARRESVALGQPARALGKRVSQSRTNRRVGGGDTDPRPSEPHFLELGHPSRPLLRAKVALGGGRVLGHDAVDVLDSCDAA